MIYKMIAFDEGKFQTTARNKERNETERNE